MKKLLLVALVIMAGGAASADDIDDEVEALSRIKHHEQLDFTSCMRGEISRLGAGASPQSLRKAFDQSCGGQERVFRAALTREGLSPVRANALILKFKSEFLKNRGREPT